MTGSGRMADPAYRVRKIGVGPEGRTVGFTSTGTLHLLPSLASVYRGGVLTALGGWPYAVPVCNGSFEVMLLPPEIGGDAYYERASYYGRQLRKAAMKLAEVVAGKAEHRIRICKYCEGHAFGQNLVELPALRMTDVDYDYDRSGKFTWQKDDLEVVEPAETEEKNQ